jgi:hypothetical protein
VEKRTKSTANKPNLTPILITTPLEISGTKTRQSLKNKEEFFVKKFFGLFLIKQD